MTKHTEALLCAAMNSLLPTTTEDFALLWQELRVATIPEQLKSKEMHEVWKIALDVQRYISSCLGDTKEVMRGNRNMELIHFTQCEMQKIRILRATPPVEKDFLQRADAKNAEPKKVALLRRIATMREQFDACSDLLVELDRMQRSQDNFIS